MSYLASLIKAAKEDHRVRMAEKPDHPLPPDRTPPRMHHTDLPSLQIPNQSAPLSQSTRVPSDTVMVDSNAQPQVHQGDWQSRIEPSPTDSSELSSVPSDIEAEGSFDVMDIDTQEVVARGTTPGPATGQSVDGGANPFDFGDVPNYSPIIAGDRQLPGSPAAGMSSSFDIGGNGDDDSDLSDLEAPRAHIPYTSPYFGRYEQPGAQWPASSHVPSTPEASHFPSAPSMQPSVSAWTIDPELLAYDAKPQQQQQQQSSDAMEISSPLRGASGNLHDEPCDVSMADYVPETGLDDSGSTDLADLSIEFEKLTAKDLEPALSSASELEAELDKIIAGEKSSVAGSAAGSVSSKPLGVSSDASPAPASSDSKTSKFGKQKSNIHTSDKYHRAVRSRQMRTGIPTFRKSIASKNARFRQEPVKKSTSADATSPKPLVTPALTIGAKKIEEKETMGKGKGKAKQKQAAPGSDAQIASESDRAKHLAARPPDVVEQEREGRRLPGFDNWPAWRRAQQYNCKVFCQLKSVDDVTEAVLNYYCLKKIQCRWHEVDYQADDGRSGPYSWEAKAKPGEKAPLEWYDRREWPQRKDLVKDRDLNAAGLATGSLWASKHSGMTPEAAAAALEEDKKRILAAGEKPGPDTPKQQGEIASTSQQPNVVVNSPTAAATSRGNTASASSLSASKFAPAPSVKRSPKHVHFAPTSPPSLSAEVAPKPLGQGLQASRFAPTSCSSAATSSKDKENQQGKEKQVKAQQYSQVDTTTLTVGAASRKEMSNAATKHSIGSDMPGGTLVAASSDAMSSDYQDVVEAQRRTIQERDATIGALEEAIKEINLKLKESAVKHDRDVALKNEYYDAGANLQVQFDALEKSEKDKSEELTKLKAYSGALESDRSSAEAAASNLRRELDEFKSKHKSLIEDVAEARGALHTAESNLQTARNEAKMKQDLLDIAGEQARQQAFQRSDLERLQQQNDDLRGRINDLEADLSNTEDQRRYTNMHLNGHFNFVAASQSDQQGPLDMRQTTSDQTQRERGPEHYLNSIDATNHRNLAEEMGEDAISTADANDGNQDQSDIVEHAEELSRLRTELASEQLLRAEAERSADHSKALLSKAHEQQEKLEIKRKEELDAMVERQAKIEAEKQRAIAELSTTIKRLEDEVNALKVARDADASHIASLKQRIQQAEVAMTAATESYDKDLTLVRSELTAAKAASEEAEYNEINLRAKLDTAEKELDALKHTEQQTIAALKTSHDELETRHNKLDADYKKLKDANDSLNAQILEHAAAVRVAPAYVDDETQTDPDSKLSAYVDSESQTLADTIDASVQTEHIQVTSYTDTGVDAMPISSKSTYVDRGPQTLPNTVNVRSQRNHTGVDATSATVGSPKRDLSDWLKWLLYGLLIMLLFMLGGTLFSQTSDHHNGLVARHNIFPTSVQHNPMLAAFEALIGVDVTFFG